MGKTFPKSYFDGYVYKDKLWFGITENEKRLIEIRPCSSKDGFIELRIDTSVCLGTCFTFKSCMYSGDKAKEIDIEPGEWVQLWGNVQVHLYVYVDTRDQQGESGVNGGLVHARFDIVGGEFSKLFYWIVTPGHSINSRDLGPLVEVAHIPGQ